MIVVTIRAAVNDVAESVYVDRFHDRIHYAAEAPGFVRNEVHRPTPLKYDPSLGTFVTDPDEDIFYEVKSWWQSLDHFVAWTKSESFRIAHLNKPPSEIFKNPEDVQFHEVFLSTDFEASD